MFISQAVSVDRRFRADRTIYRAYVRDIAEPKMVREKKEKRKEGNVKSHAYNAITCSS